MLLKDLMEIYRIYYTHILEILERFPSLGKKEAQKAFVMYQNFVNLTEAIKNKANKLIYIFNFPITFSKPARSEGPPEIEPEHTALVSPHRRSVCPCT